MMPDLLSRMKSPAMSQAIPRNPASSSVSLTATGAQAPTEIAASPIRPSAMDSRAAVIAMEITR